MNASEATVIASDRFPRAPLHARAIAALPDVVTASAYLITWLAPTALANQAVKLLMLLMLVEFIMVHSGGLLGGLMLDEKKSKTKKSLALLGMSAFYFIFIGAFAWSFESTWPIYTFGWLVLAKLIGVFTADRQSHFARQWQMRVWGVSVGAYLVAVFATSLLWVPKLGIQSEIIPTLGLKGGGLWVDQPQTVIAAGLIYFGLMAWFKWTQPDWALKRQE